MPGGLVAEAVAAAVAMVSDLVSAHEGHEHTVTGTVIAIDDKRIEVEASDGERVTGALSAYTNYVRDEAAASRPDVRLGERVVIVVVEGPDELQKVKQVLLGGAPSVRRSPSEEPPG